MSPDGYTLDIAYLARPGRIEIQLDLILDYRSNVALYPVFQAYLRQHRPPLLAAWGRKDAHFVPAGALAFGPTCLTPKSISSMPATLPWRLAQAEIGALMLVFLGRTLERRRQ